MNECKLQITRDSAKHSIFGIGAWLNNSKETDNLVFHCWRERKRWSMRLTLISNFQRTCRLSHDFDLFRMVFVKKRLIMLGFLALLLLWWLFEPRRKQISSITERFVSLDFYLLCLELFFSVIWVPRPASKKSTLWDIAQLVSIYLQLFVIANCLPSVYQWIFGYKRWECLFDHYFNITLLRDHSASD